MASFDEVTGLSTATKEEAIKLAWAQKSDRLETICSAYIAKLDGRPFKHLLDRAELCRF